MTKQHGVSAYLWLPWLAALLPALGGQDSLPYEQRQDVVYAEVHGTGLLMDIFTPKGPANGLGIIDVVSGAWHSDRGKIRDHTLAQLYTIYGARGYVVFAARPGSRTRYTASEMARHVKLAIRYAKEHAADFKLDSRRLGLIGASAGGHLALLTALSPEDGKPDARLALERHDTRVKAVGVFFPPTDFLDWTGDGKLAALDFLKPLLFLGDASHRSEEEVRAAARAISPLHRVAKTDIPWLLIHGDADPLVPLTQSKRFVEAMKAAGNSIELIVKPGGGHPWLTLPEEVRVMADWFDRQLGAPRNAFDGRGGPG